MVENKEIYEMKTLLTPLLLILIALPSYASELPPCPKDQTQTYHNCFGTYTWADGDKYVGEHKDGKSHGKGTFTWADGEKYVGEFKNGDKHGKGTYTFASGKVKSGIWADDEYLYDLAEHRRREENNARTECAKEAGKAGTEYAAKEIDKTCLAEKQLEPES